MAVPTLQQLIEEVDAKKAVCKVIIGGTTLPVWKSVSYSFEIGQVPTATIVVPGLANLPLAVAEEAAVQIWLGYQSGVTVLYRQVFGGAVVDSVGNNGAEITITCVMDGPRKLSYSYNRRIAYDFDNVTAVESVTALLDLAGVTNYVVDLDPWLIGTAVPYTAALGNQIQFSSYGDAINKVAEVDGSPWWATPTGQVRVEKRDPVPSPTAHRTYFTGILTGPIETQPIGVGNDAARPRITDISKNKSRRDVANFIEVDGAVVVSLGPSGEQNSDQIKETVDGISGQFPNGAYWIPTPPLFQDFNFSNELIDTNAKAFEVCERYFDLKNRLFEELPITVPGDPDVFLCETVAVKDPIYSGTASLYFVKGYSTTIDENSCTTTLNLTGGPESGTIGYAKPFADFTWTYDALITPGGGNNGLAMPPNTNVGAKLCEDLPEDTQSPPGQETFKPAAQGNATVYIGFDGTASQDFDGYIVSYVWTWKDEGDVEHTVNGALWTLIVDPTVQSSVQVTLTVTDNSGRTDFVTKTVSTSASVPPDNSFDANNQQEDTNKGGGASIGECTKPESQTFPTNPYGEDQPIPPPGGCNGLEKSMFVAAKTVAMASLDNRTWNDLTKAAAGASGDFISVDAGVNNQDQTAIGIFGTTAGEIVRTIDYCETGEVVFTGSGRIECVHFDTTSMGDSGGDIPPPSETPGDGVAPIYTESNPGTLTIVQAYQQCRTVGFSHDTAIVAVAIMVRESGLYSHATNTAGNTPPSTDRGICQWNNYYHPDISDACAFNTECAITKMYQKSSGGSDFSPWNVSGPGTYLQKTNLSAVQAAVGSLSDSSIATQTPASNIAPSSVKVWAGTSTGQIYVSTDSGKTWKLHKDFGDGYPIYQLGTPPRYGAQSDSLWAIGGNTANIDSLVRIDAAKTGDFTPLHIEGDLRRALQVAGGGDHARATFNDTAMALVFSGGGMTERVWTSTDPISTPDSWIACGVTTGSYDTVAGGYGGELIVAGSVVEKTDDNETFASLGAGPSNVNHIVWRGMEGMYTAAFDGGVYQTLDFGDNFGPMRPNASFGTTWPGGAEAKQVAIAIGARKCIPPTPGACDNAPRYEAAAGNQIGAEILTNHELFSDSIVGASDTTPDTSLVTTYFEGDAHHNKMGKKSASGTSLVLTITPTIIDSFLFLAIVSRPGDTPVSVTDDQSLTWTQMYTTQKTDTVGDIRLSVYRANTNADAVLGLTITVAFTGAQDIILAIADEWIGLKSSPGTDPIVDSAEATA